MDNRITATSPLLSALDEFYLMLKDNWASQWITNNGFFHKRLEAALAEYRYFPIFINAEEYGKTRDQLYFEMKEKGILGRLYFYPLISEFSIFRALSSAAYENLPVATRIVNEVICLSMNYLLSEEDIQRIHSYIISY